VRDPLEGLAPDGTIRTGAARERIPERFEPVLETVVARVHATAPASSVYVYGSVATGIAESPRSDVDLLVVGLDAQRATRIGERLSADFAHLCRAVETASSTASDFVGDDDAAYGARVFLHHYCVHLAGPDVDRATSAFPGDARAARGFNGDIARHVDRWGSELDGGADPGPLGRRVARKSLLAVAGLVSVHDSTWTTDRELAAHRWRQVDPALADGLDELLAWSTGRAIATPERLGAALHGTVDAVVAGFAAGIGLWAT
jgi:uncharacterized protein